ncbi:MAG: translocation/assembly module TamB domain-containing protein [Myxococcota bacterium]
MKWAGRLAGALGLLVLVAAGALVAFGFWLRTEGGREWLLGQLLAAADPPNGDLVVGSIETDLFSEARLHDVELRDAAGRTLVRAVEIRARYRLGGLPGKVLRVTDVEVVGLTGDLVVTDDGLDLASLWPATGGPPSGPYEGLPIDVIVDRVVVDAPRLRVTAGEVPYGVDGATLTAGVRLVGDAVEVTGLSLDAQSTEPALGALALRGDVTWRSERTTASADLSVGPQRVAARGEIAGDALAVEVTALHLEPDALPWEVPVKGPLDGTGRIEGTTGAPSVALAVTTPGGPATLTASADLTKEPVAWAFAATTPGLAVDAVVEGLADTRVAGTVRAEGTGTSWPEGVDASVEVDARAESVAGQGPARVAAKGRLAGGVLELPGVVAEVEAGTVRIDARVSLVEGTAQAKQVVADVDLAKLARFGVVGLRGHVRFVGHVDGGWTAGTRAHAAGSIAGDGLGWQETVWVARATGPVDVAWTGGEVQLEAALAAEGVTAPSTTAPVATLQVKARAAPGGAVSLDGLARVEALGAGPVSVEAVDATFAVTVEGGVPDVRVTAATGAVRGPGLAGDRAAASVRLAGDAATISADVRAGERLVVGTDAVFDLTARAVRAERLVLAPGPTAWRGEGTQRARFDEDGVSDVHLRLVSGNSAIVVEGDAHLMGRMGLTATVSRFPVAWLAELDPEAFAGFAGTVDARAAIQGPATRPDVLAEVRLAGLVVPGTFRDLDAHVVAEGRGERMTIDATLGPDDDPLALVDGTLPVRLDVAEPGLLPRGEVDLHVVLPPGELTRWNTVWAGEDLPRARLSAEVALTGPMIDPELRVVVSAEAPAGERGDWVRVDVDVTPAGDQLAVRGVVWQERVRRARLDGVVTTGLDRVMATLLRYGRPADLADPNTWVSDLTVSVVPLRLPVQALAALAPVPPAITGDLVGALLVTGSPTRPVVQGGLQLVGAKLDRMPVAPASLDLQTAEGGYKVAVDLGFGTGAALHAGGFVPFGEGLASDLATELAREGLDLGVDGEVPLRAIAAVWPELYDARGSLALNGGVTGSVLAPRPDLRARMEGPREGEGATFSLAPTGVRYEDVRLDVEVDDTEIRIRDLSMRTRPAGVVEVIAGSDEPNVTGELTVTREGWMPGRKEGRIALRNAYLTALPERTLLVREGSVTVSGDRRRVVLEGDVALANARVVADERFFAGTTDLALPSEIVVHRPGMVAGETRAREDTVLPKWLGLDVAADLERNAFVRATMPLVQDASDLVVGASTLDVEAQLDGRVRVFADRGELSLEGQVLPIRGTAILLGKTFDVEEGSTVAFTGGADYTNPVLDLRATYDAGEYGDIGVRISGTPSAPLIEFQSDEYPSTDDIFAILLVGSPASEAGAGGEAQDFNAIAEAFLTSQLRGLGEQTGSSLRLLDLVQIGAESARVGKRLGPSVFLVVEIDYLADDEEDSVTTAIVEMRLPLAAQLEASAGTAGDAELAVTWTLRW